MGFTVSTRPGRAGERSGDVVELAAADGSVRAEVWPFAGFNALRWQVRRPDGGWADLLYAAPDWAVQPVPTRSGHPVLFPFPNRLRAGRFAFRGAEYRLPLTESSGRHAIHGFAPRNPWAVAAATADADGASVTGRFRAADFGPWPGDPVLTLTYRLTATSLRADAVVANAGDGPTAFGLGYHPYLRPAVGPDVPADAFVLATAARSLWEAADGLPTGRKLPPPAEVDFRAGRAIGAAALDHLLGDVAAVGDPDGGRRVVARLSHPDGGNVDVRADPAFGELVVFTPPHRRAVAVEPYTCATDAANLQPAGVPAGWRELAAGERFAATVEYSWRG